MQTIKKLLYRWRHPKTLVEICISRLVLYVLYVTLVYQIFAILSNATWRQSFPEIEDYVGYSSYLVKDEFDRIPSAQFKNCGILIYGEQGRAIYATDPEMSMLISAQDLRFIPDMSEYYTYRVIEGEDEDLWIFKVNMADLETYANIDEFCHVDGEYHIIEGSLFGDLGKGINKKSIGFLRGMYSQNRLLQKYSYTNVNGRQRTLVFLAPAVTARLLEEYSRQEDLLWLIYLLCDIVGAVVIALRIARRVRLSLLPLNSLFESYSNEQKIDSNIVIPEELASIEQSFIQLTEKLEKANHHRLEAEQEKNRMIADLSHDLKSPLTVIKGFSEALLQGKVSAEDTDKYLEIIRKKSDVSVEMINNLMQYATMEHPDYSMQKEKIDLCEFLRVCLISRYDELEEDNIDLELEIPEEEIFYPIDRRIMGSVMENLINNTIRYSGPGTTIYLFIEQNDMGIIVTFADNGVGIPEDIRKDVFKPFVIGNQARTSSKGTGIGMSIIRRGIEMHGGTVLLADPVGTSFSTIFEMRFPPA